jgi:8-oxo-dGTP diphosphatase
MIRLNVAALIVRDEQVLLIEFDDESGLHYNLPGGGVEEGETLADALQREAWEEAGAKIDVGRLLLIWEYVPVRENYRHGTTHKVGLIYECVLQAGSEPHFPAQPDTHQTGVRWLPLAKLAEVETVNYFGEALLHALCHRD